MCTNFLSFSGNQKIKKWNYMEGFYDVVVCLISLTDVMFFCGTHNRMRNHQLEHPSVMVQKKLALIFSAVSLFRDIYMHKLFFPQVHSLQYLIILFHHSEIYLPFSRSANCCTPCQAWRNASTLSSSPFDSCQYFSWIFPPWHTESDDESVLSVLCLVGVPCLWISHLLALDDG